MVSRSCDLTPEGGHLAMCISGQACAVHFFDKPLGLRADRTARTHPGRCQRRLKMSQVQIVCNFHPPLRAAFRNGAAVAWPGRTGGHWPYWVTAEDG